MTTTPDPQIDRQAREELQQAGWQVVEPLGEPGRFAWYKVEKDGVSGFAKYAQAELEAQVAKDALWSQLLARLVVQRKLTETLRPPKLLYHTPRCNVFEWVPGEALAVQGERVPHLEDPVVKQVAKALITLDGLALAAPGQEESWFIPEYRKRKLQNMQDGVAAAWERKWLNEVQMRQLLTMRGTVPERQAVLQHGDLAPWHIIFNGDTTVVVDGEWSSVGYPRWYDLAYLYGRIAARGRNPVAAAAILQAVVDEVKDGDTVVEQVFALLAERVFHELHSAVIDSEENYSQNATSLLAVILSGDPQRLLRSIAS